MTCRFKLNIHMLFYQISHVFSHFLIISRYDFIIFDFIVTSVMKFAHTVCIQSKYIQNQVVYYFGMSIYRQSRAFLE